MEMLKLHVKLEEKLMNLKSCSMRENVRIYGVLEGAKKESQSMVTFVENLLLEGVDLRGLRVPDLQTERAQHSVGPQPPEDPLTPSIIAKFSSFKMKETLLCKAWQGNGFTWQDNHINLDHDLLPLLRKTKRICRGL